MRYTGFFISCLLPLACSLFPVPVIRCSLFPGHSAITNNLGLLAFWPRYARLALWATLRERPRYANNQP
ncbi:MAG: hypothetical protein F6J90_28545 [Moorea sp. SIOASIH]|uniref:hypothetical protein n=1 Tax=Moorena sp. SIOASIH TaxID=2607817 RepID=UPI0013BCCC79|nr:hypothetical protein [Moorena sp. SIOASIH]NEO40073.1 hypothetical protein [Moorena sp. SIOASIH]